MVTNNMTLPSSSVGKKKRRLRDKEQDFFTYAESLIRQLRKMEKPHMANRYTTTLNSLSRYLNQHTLPLSAINDTLTRGYEAWLRQQGLCRNSSSFYLRNLRAIYNRAVNEGLAPQSSTPFRQVYTGIDQTCKRALTLNNLQRLRDLNLSKRPRMALARDLFLFSFYTRGMSFIDMAQLTTDNLHGGVLTYCRRKTSQQLHIRWEEKMQQIVSRYHVPGSLYLLPIATGTGETFRQSAKKSYNRINRQLKRLGELLEFPIPLTTYVSRHSWATLAKSQNVSISLISEGLGHNSERTTRIYLASLDTSPIDEANKKIIDLL